MSVSERSLLLETQNLRISGTTTGLSVFFSIICIVDVFGVFPIVILPKAIIDCGFYGILTIGVICGAQVYAAILLGKCWIIAEEIDLTIHRKNRYPYSALAALTFGNNFSNFVTCLLDATVFAAGIPNLIVASQNLQLLGLRLSNNNFDVSFCFWMIILGAVLCPLLWLGSPKDMKLLCTVSVSIVISVFMLVTGSLIFTTRQESSKETEEVAPILDRPLWEFIFVAYGIIAFQFDVHPSILTIQVDMLEKKKLNRAVLGGFLATLSMFGVTTMTAAFKLGKMSQPSILEALPTNTALHLAAILVSVQLCLTSAISNSALYQHMEDCMGISRRFNHRRCILRTTLTLFGILIAESVPRFDLVMSLIGGLLTGPIIFIFPPLFYMRILHMQQIHKKQLKMESFTNVVYDSEKMSKKLAKYFETQFKNEFESNPNLITEEGFTRLNKFEFFLSILIIVVCGIFTVATTYLNVSRGMDYAIFPQPCIYNVSSALINL